MFMSMKEGWRQGRRVGFGFGKRSRRRMQGLHPDLVAVMELALSRSAIDFTVIEGLRSIERQRKLVKSGASRTLKSRHLTGHAIDVAPLLDGRVSWDWPLYYQIAPVIKGAAADLGVDLDWGGDWQTFKDGPHWQLSWESYAKDDLAARVRPAPAALADTADLTVFQRLGRVFQGDKV